jgi:hypothetical protein
MAADDAAKGTGSETDTQGSEGRQGTGDGVTGGEERSSEVQCSGSAETDEVIRLDHRAHTGANCNAPGVFGSMDRTAHVQSIFAHGGSLSKSG